MLKMTARRALRPLSRQRGLSLVELMVGIAIGLFVVGAGILGMTTSLTENRQLLLEARLQQDLRAAMDLITRDIRRAGYWGSAISGLSNGASAPASNPLVSIGIMPLRSTPTASSTTPVSSTGAAVSSLSYSWDQDADGALDSNETYSFELNSGKIRMSIGSNNWQDVTDSSTVEITSFSITPSITWLPLYDKCTTTCNPTTGTCPETAVRTLLVEITGRAPSDTSVRRTLRSRVRVRNDQVTGSCPA